MTKREGESLKVKTFTIDYPEKEVGRWGEGGEDQTLNAILYTKKLSYGFRGKR